MLLPKPKHPVFIVSRGRARVAKTPNFLTSVSIPFTLVVEPHEEAEYRRAFPKAGLFVLSESNRGIVFARQSLLDHVRSYEKLYYWQLDDNILSWNFVHKINTRVNRVTTTTPGHVLRGIEELVEDESGARVALAAADYQQLAWRKKELFSWNRAALCCVLTRTDTKINYRPETEMKEDIDFTLQHIASGWNTLLSHKLCMGKPTMGSNKSGGLVEKYRAGQQSEAARKLVELWPGIVSLKDEGARGLDVRIKWNKLN